MRRHKRGGGESEVDLTPMLDIVFIMLIFFIVTASFVRERGLDVTRPEQQEDEPQQAREAILLTISQDSEVFLFEPDTGEMRLIDVRAVRANVERLYAENDERTVIIQPHVDSQTGVLVRVMDQARVSGAPVAIGESIN